MARPQSPPFDMRRLPAELRVAIYEFIEPRDRIAIILPHAEPLAGEVSTTDEEAQTIIVASRNAISRISKVTRQEYQIRLQHRVLQGDIHRYRAIVQDLNFGVFADGFLPQLNDHVRSIISVKIILTFTEAFMARPQHTTLTVFLLQCELMGLKGETLPTIKFVFRARTTTPQERERLRRCLNQVAFERPTDAMLIRINRSFAESAGYPLGPPRKKTTFEREGAGYFQDDPDWSGESAVEDGYEV